MAVLYYYLFNENMKSLFFLKIFLFIFLLWTYMPYNDCSLDNILEWKKKHGRNMDFRYNRLLTKRDFQKGKEHKILRDDLHGYEKNKEIKTEKAISTYGSLKPEGLNYYDTYKKKYKQRYSKKSGLSKLDCYFEKKLFDKIDSMCILEENMKNNKNYFKRKIKNKYIIPFIIFALLPILGLIFPILFWDGNPLFNRYCFNDCTNTHNTTGKTTITEIHDAKDIKLFPFSQPTFEILKVINYIYLFVAVIITFVVTIYIALKIMKYRGLMAGKSKLSIREYYNLMKY